MPILVMKFGGTSVADPERILNAAQKVKREVDAGWNVAVIVSAMSGETNKLVGLVRGISPLYDAREYDAIVASGEQVTSGLMALTLQSIGVPARSWQGWQIAMRTDSTHGAARIEEIDTAPMLAKFEEGLHAVSGQTPARLRLLRRSRLIGVTSTRMLMASTRPTRVLYQKPEKSRKSPSKRCWNWHHRARKCFKPGPLNWPCVTMYPCRCAPASRMNREPLSAMRMRSWKAMS